MQSIIFIGGIHGVGKGSLCAKVCNDLNLRHLSASEVLKWEEISERENKLVKDFTLTQNRLITNLQQIVNENERYILDGHYCLLNRDNVPEKIDFDTFRTLNPFAFVIVVDDVQEIKRRLENRDNKEYNFELLLKFQELEVKYSIELAEQLNKPHLILKSEEPRWRAGSTTGVQVLPRAIYPPLARRFYLVPPLACRFYLAPLARRFYLAPSIRRVPTRSQGPPSRCAPHAGLLASENQATSPVG